MDDEPEKKDSLGLRDLDAEAKHRLTNAKDNPRPDKKRKTTGDFAKSTSILVDMLKALNHNIPIQISVSHPSTFVPSSIMLFRTIFEMDNIMSINRYWSSKTTLWSPILTRLAYGILFYIQILRCMRTARTISMALSHLLSNFEEQFDYSTIPIPGPLVPFFKVLTVCQPPFAEFGEVSPRIPSLCDASGNRSHSLPEDVMCLLPNIVGLRRSACTMLRAHGNHALPWDHDLGDSQTAHNAGVPRAHNAANQQAANANITPGVMNPIPWDERLRDFYQRAPRHIPIPDVPANAPRLTWKSYLGFSDSLHWFGELIGIMQLYSRFWNGSITMESCSLRDGGSGLVICQIQNDFLNRDNHRAANALIVPSSSIIESPAFDIDDTSARLGMFTQINSVLPANYGPNDNIGAVNTTRFGPWWNVQPNRLTSLEYDPSILLPVIIARDAALERPSK